MSTKTATLTARVEFRMPARLKKEVEEAAALVGATFTDFATQVLVERARQVKQGHGLTVLGDQARDAFVEMIENPPPPSEALRQTLATRIVEI